MSPKDLIGFSITVLIAVFGWGIAHWLTSKRELEQKKREFRVKHLREAYLKIANLCDRGTLASGLDDLQDALNDIQLFGEESQIALVAKVVQSFTESRSADFNELLKQLRNEIRGHIGLKPLNSTRWYVRFRKREPSDPPNSSSGDASALAQPERALNSPLVGQPSVAEAAMPPTGLRE